MRQMIVSDATFDKMINGTTQLLKSVQSKSALTAEETKWRINTEELFIVMALQTEVKRKYLKIPDRIMDSFLISSMDLFASMMDRETKSSEEEEWFNSFKVYATEVVEQMKKQQKK